MLTDGGGILILICYSQKLKNRVNEKLVLSDKHEKEEIV